MNTRNMHVYIPEEYMDNWLGWVAIDANGESKGHDHEQLIDPAKLRVAYQLARDAGMENEGITRFLTTLPSHHEYDGELVFGFKQSNNGTSFIVSPHRLPWLEGAWE